MVAQMRPISKHSTGGQPAVMIVEDEQTARRALSLLLSASGYRPHAFRSAEEALAYVSDHALPRIALIDLDLPGMSGLDLIGLLEGLDPAVFPVLITATDEDKLAAQLHNRRVAYLRKPFDFDILLTLLAEHSSRN
jgi:DNA-binding NtrC family response regulator